MQTYNQSIKLDDHQLSNHESSLISHLSILRLSSKSLLCSRLPSLGQGLHVLSWRYGMQLGVGDDPHVGHGKVETHECVPVGDTPSLTLPTTITTTITTAATTNRTGNVKVGKQR